LNLRPPRPERGALPDGGSNVVRRLEAAGRDDRAESADRRGGAEAQCAAADLTTADGMVRRKAGGTGDQVRRSPRGQSFHLKLDPKAPLRDPRITPSSASRCRGRTCFSSLELCGECELANLIKKDSQARRRLLLRLGTASWPACRGLLGGPARRACWGRCAQMSMLERPRLLDICWTPIASLYLTY
jgi:hypothetical protein